MNDDMKRALSLFTIIIIITSVFLSPFLFLFLQASPTLVSVTTGTGTSILRETWNRTFTAYRNYNDTSYAVQQTADGGYILAGVTYPFGAGTSDAWLVKTDSEGNELWNMTFGGASYDAALAVQLTPDGGYVFAGYTQSYGAGNADAWLVKTDSEGNELWNMTFGGASYDEALAVQPTPDDGYLFTGRTWSYGAGNADAWLLKTDSGGEELWNMTFGGTGYDDSRAIQRTPDGGYILAGSTFSFSSDSSSDFWLIKLGITNISFDTGSGYGTYPSISGIHKGIIIPRQDMHISKLYTYPCTGTGGHTESIALYEDDDSEPIATGIWKGYHSHSDWHNITLYDAATRTPGIRLLKEHQYRYVISTGSYPQIIHKREHKSLDGSTIKCIEFKDVNGKVYHDWIPAIRFYS